MCERPGRARSLSGAMTDFGEARMVFPDEFCQVAGRGGAIGTSPRYRPARGHEFVWPRPGHDSVPAHGRRARIVGVRGLATPGSTLRISSPALALVVAAQVAAGGEQVGEQ